MNILDQLQQDALRRQLRRKVGFWRRRADGVKGQYETDEEAVFPWPEAGAVYSHNVKVAVVEYLDERMFEDAGYRGWSCCRLCGKVLGTHDYSDGVWIWPEKLSHYILDHSVKLPDEFIDHVLRQANANL